MLEDYEKEQANFVSYIKRIIKEDKIAHAYLIEANDIDYAYDMALSLAKTLNCPNKYINNKKCKDCSICSNIDKNNYPDIIVIENEGKEIKKEQMLELQKSFSKKPLYGKYLIYIIKNANLLNNSSANAILKFLEEPDANIIAILLTNNIYNCLETIVSRCQILNLKEVNSELNKNEFIAICPENKDIDDFIKEEQDIITNIFYNIEELKTHYLLDEDIYQYKDKFLLFLQIGLYLYLDILKYKMGLDLTNYLEYRDIIEKIIEKNSLDDIIRKIEVINQFLEKIKYNVNKELFIDNFVITFCGGIDEN